MYFGYIRVPEIFRFESGSVSVILNPFGYLINFGSNSVIFFRIGFGYLDPDFLSRLCM